MLTVVREMAEEAELPGVRASRRGGARAGSSRAARTPSRGRRSCSTCSARPGSSTRAGPGCSSSSAASLHGLTGEPLPDVPDVTEELTETSIHHEESEYRYCTVFVVEGEELDPDALDARLEQLGDSLLVVGDESIAKVHVHTDEPAGALAVGRAVGVVDQARVEIGDMHSQAAERERWLAQLHAAAQAEPSEVALVAVARAGEREAAPRATAPRS